MIEADQLDLGSYEVDIGRKQAQIRDDRLSDCLVCRFTSQECVIDGGIQIGLLDAKPRRGIALRIEVDHEGFLIGQSQPSGQIHGGGRLSDAALLIDDRKPSPDRHLLSL